MAAPPFVAARVTPEMKTLLSVLAEREQVTESALVRQLLEVMLRVSAKEGFPKLDALEKSSRDTRLSVRLAPEPGPVVRSGDRPWYAFGHLRVDSRPVAPSESSAPASGRAAGIVHRSHRLALTGPSMREREIQG